MAINKVGSKGIEDGSVASADFAPNTVTSAKLQDGAVTNAKLTNTSVTLAGSSVSLGGSVSFNNKFVDWQSVITADGSTGTTAVSGQGYFIDTTSAAHTLTLPSSAAIGDFIAIKDYAGTFGTNNLTIARNGHNIQGVANDSLITTNRASLVLVYVDSTKGWLYWEEHNVADLENAAFISATGGTITTSGDYKIHTFTGDGCFVVSCAGLGPSAYTTADYIVVAGGGGGGSVNGGGGGAGGYRESSGTATGCYTASPLGACVSALTVSATTYPITVGSGGTGQVYPGGTSTAGSNSVFSTITSAGGGRGTCTPNGDGGSGGGAPQSPSGVAGLGNTPPVSPPQGNPGGTGFDTAGGGVGWKVSGSGGGAIGVGGTALSPGPANTYNPAEDRAGGAGATTSISGSPTSYSGGGAGSMETGSFGAIPIAPGGIGGGGSGGSVPGGGPFPTTIVNSTAGTANTGGGGGGGAERAGPNDVASGKSGGKGIVIIRYKFQ